VTEQFLDGTSARHGLFDVIKLDENVFYPDELIEPSNAISYFSAPQQNDFMFFLVH